MLGTGMKCRVHGIILLVVALLVLSHYVLRGWDRDLWTGRANPGLPGQAVGVTDLSTIDERSAGQSGQAP